MMNNKKFRNPHSKPESNIILPVLLIASISLVLFFLLRPNSDKNLREDMGVTDNQLIDIDKVDSEENALPAPEEIDMEPDRPLKKIQTCVLTAWKDGIVPYSFEKTIAPDIKQVVQGAMDVWESVCKVQFVEKPDGHYRIQKWNGNYIWSTVGSDSCGTSPGMRVSIKGYKNYSEIKRAMLHELGHCLGLTHEHQRPDRDDFVSIRWDNIEKYGRYNFIKKQNPLIDISRHYYDYKSIMHYRSRAFSKNKEKTIIFHRGEPNINFSLSDGDIDKIQTIYGWKAHEETFGACIDDYNCVGPIKQFNCFGFNPSFFPDKNCSDIYSQLGKEANDDIDEQTPGTDEEAGRISPKILEVVLLAPDGSIIDNARSGETVKISYRVFDPDIDIAYIHQKIIAPSGKIYHTAIRKLPGQKNEHSGYVSRIKAPKQTGRWYFITMMEDKKGNISNEVSVDFEVVR